MLPKCTKITFSETAPKMENCVSTKHAAADRGSGRPGNREKEKKKRLVSLHARHTRFVHKKYASCRKKCRFHMIFSTFWTFCKASTFLTFSTFRIFDFSTFSAYLNFSTFSTFQFFQHFQLFDLFNFFDLSNCCDFFDFSSF